MQTVFRKQQILSLKADIAGQCQSVPRCWELLSWVELVCDFSYCIEPLHCAIRCGDQETVHAVSISFGPWDSGFAVRGI